MYSEKAEKGDVKMDSDIKLNNGTLEIIGDELKADVKNAEIGFLSNGKFKGMRFYEKGIGCNTYALMVNNPDFQQTDSQMRIALAQSTNDELLINVNGHYTGGVNVDGNLTIKDNLTVKKSITMGIGSKMIFLTPNRTLRLPNGKTSIMPGTPIDIIETITRLENTIKQLQDRIAALEAR